MKPSGRGAVVTAALGLVVILAGCAGANLSPAPVEDRSPINPPRTATRAGSPNGTAPAPVTSRPASATTAAARTAPASPASQPTPSVAAPPAAAAPAPAVSAPVRPTAVSSPVTSVAVKTLPGNEMAGQPGTYTVRPGDTLIKIGLEHGQNWRDIAQWSGLDNPNQIEVGQVLRVVPPSAAPPVVATASPVRPQTELAGARMPAPAASPGPPASAAAAEGVGTQAPLSGATAPAAQSGASPALAASNLATPTAPRSVDVRPPSAAPADEVLEWAWPASGPVLAAFDEPRGVKGVALGGRAGDPVLAAADGRVVYAGSGLRGYGNLLIVKHNATYLTAYAHNQALLVKEDQVVRRGQKIAEMGSSDADRVKLHFEVRRLGKPVDPTQLLPTR